MCLCAGHGGIKENQKQSSTHSSSRHYFETSSQWQVLAAWLPIKEPHPSYSARCRPDRPQGSSRCFGEQKKFLPVLRIEPQNTLPLARLLYLLEEEKRVVPVPASVMRTFCLNTWIYLNTKYILCTFQAGIRRQILPEKTYIHAQ
jgi:hypothetical protein